MQRLVGQWLWMLAHITYVVTLVYLVMRILSRMDGKVPQPLLATGDG